MTPVYLTACDLWVHAGPSGLMAGVICNEMKSSDWYAHDPINTPNPVIVDVGGHIGIFTKEMARRYPQGQVFYIEPEPRNRVCAEKNLVGLPNVVKLYGAITYEEDVVFYPYSDEGGNSGGSQLLSVSNKPFDNACTHQPPVRVMCLTLESIFKSYRIDRVDLLKLDCEGSEYSIIQHATCLDKIDVIAGEWHLIGGPSFAEVCALRLPDWERIMYPTPNSLIGNFKLINPRIRK